MLRLACRDYGLDRPSRLDIEKEEAAQTRFLICIAEAPPVGNGVELMGVVEYRTVVAAGNMHDFFPSFPIPAFTGEEPIQLTGTVKRLAGQEPLRHKKLDFVYRRPMGQTRQPVAKKAGASTCWRRRIQIADTGPTGMIDMDIGRTVVATTCETEKGDVPPSRINHNRQTNCLQYPLEGVLDTVIHGVPAWEVSGNRILHS